MSDFTILSRPSPNFGDRRNGAVPDMVVLHYTAMQTAEAALQRLCDPEFEVSAHYLIDEKGTIFQMVDEAHRAWHAGAGQWGALTDVNSHSIGIELANNGASPFAADQMDALDRLLADILARHAIPPERVIGHSDMAPERKIDPGPRFDWARLSMLGLSIFNPDISPVSGNNIAFVQYLRDFGYPECRACDLLSAFRARFRPNAEGPLDGVDFALAQNLAARFPVDHSPSKS